MLRRTMCMLPLSAGIFISLSASAAFAQTSGEEIQIRPRIMESVPRHIDERRRLRRNTLLDALKALPAATTVHPYMVIVEKAKWRPGRVITVAFRGGNPDLYANIESAASEWTQFANIKFDFGKTDATGSSYRTWSPRDRDYKADIRIGFNEDGYWSTVGTESRDPEIVKPGQASMNYEGFDKGTPAEWRSVVIHEFGHAIGLEHEHQHPLGGCDWRWSDDAGYKATRGQSGEFIRDAQGRYPGIYRVLGGPPNKWKKADVDRNIRQLPNTSAYRFGQFDKTSIMKYQFDAWMFLKGDQSICYSEKNEILSSEDKTRIAEYYPKDPVAAQSLNTKVLNEVTAITSTVASSPVLKGALQRIETEFKR